eukprot:8208802-Pyramimonas_sp.AAC.1
MSPSLPGTGGPPFSSAPRPPSAPRTRASAHWGVLAEELTASTTEATLDYTHPPRSRQSELPSWRG